jgi:hypothetical protein
MAYTLEYNHALRIVELVYTGLHTSQESRESTSKAIALGKEHGDADALVDATEAKLAVSIFDLFDLPDRQYVAENMKREIRVAVVPPSRPEDQEAARFYETACFNRGWQVRLFPDRDHAIAWLKGTDTSKKPNTGDA